MIKPVLYITILFVSLSFTVQAQQNLVPNGSFEEYNWCPNSTDGYFLEASKYWRRPTLGSSDYFNGCSTEIDGSFGNFLYSVPENFIGHQEAKSGTGYAGYYAALDPNNDNYYEYVSVELNAPLDEGRIYHLTYYVSLADSVYKAANGIPQQFVNYSAAYFSEHLDFINSDAKLNVTPQIVSNPTIFLDDSLGWQLIDGYIIASGKEKYITIGYFCDLQDIQYNYANNLTNYGVIAYYYLDDVCLEEINIDIPNCLTPNGDGINDVFYFDTPLKYEIIILNRWGNIVFQSENDPSSLWDGTVKGEQCAEGTYFFELHFGSLVKTGFIQLIR